MIEELKKQLPNIPEEVVINWLLPFAQTDGIPSHPHNEWDKSKTGEVLPFWNDADWEKLKLDITKLPYSRGHHKSIDSLYAGYMRNESNPNVDHMGQGGKRRFRNCFLYILENGAFPVAPILTITHKNEYQVLDGNHRFAAYKAATQAYLEAKSAPEEMIKSLGIEIVEPQSIQEVWVCKPNWDNSSSVKTQRYLLASGIDIDKF